MGLGKKQKTDLEAGAKLWVVEGKVQQRLDAPGAPLGLSGGRVMRQARKGLLVEE